jgi:phospholipid/cholesterol/gamma-HCH transport system substrate-binding protein
MAIHTEAKVGALAVVAVTALVLGFDFLKGNNTFQRGRDFYVVYDKVPGLQESDPIRVNDLLIGRVKDLTLRDDYTIMARLNITEDFPIPVDSRAMISSADFLGAKQVDLVIGKSDRLARSGDTLRGTIEVGIQEAIREELRPITSKVQALISSIDSSMTVVNAIFSGETGEDVENSLTSISEALTNFRNMSLRVDNMVARQTRNVDTIFSSLATVSQGFADKDAEMQRILENLAAITDSLAAAEFAATVTDARDAIRGLGAIIERVEDGEGTLGKLVQDDALYENLNASSQDLDALLKDIEANPGRYVTLFRIGGGRRDRE